MSSERRYWQLCSFDWFSRIKNFVFSLEIPSSCSDCSQFIFSLLSEKIYFCKYTCQNAPLKYTLLENTLVKNTLLKSILLEIRLSKVHFWKVYFWKYTCQNTLLKSIFLKLNLFPQRKFPFAAVIVFNLSFPPVALWKLTFEQ